MTLYTFTDKKVLTIREQLQEDLITLLDSQFGEVDYLDDVKDLACQIVVDNFADLIKLHSLKNLRLIHSRTNKLTSFLILSPTMHSMKMMKNLVPG